MFDLFPRPTRRSIIHYAIMLTSVGSGYETGSVTETEVGKSGPVKNLNRSNRTDGDGPAKLTVTLATAAHVVFKEMDCAKLF